MNLYFAPMEGITGFRYRNIHHAFFGKHIDKYFTPFLCPNAEHGFVPREMRDILPENNENIPIVPQMLSNNAPLFIKGAKILSDYGYKEINLNLGCPAKTVVSKGRGSGFLAYPEKLDKFLYEIFDKTCTFAKLSVKTRLGKISPDEFFELIDIFNKYKMEELIIHPRIQTDFYKNVPNMTVFSEAVILSKNPVCYNGDIFTLKHFQSFHEAFPNIGDIMLGRGLLMNPNLAGEIHGEPLISFEQFFAFHNAVYEMYRRELSGDKPVLFKMKELWVYMSGMFENADKLIKKIKKSQHCADYEAAVRQLFNCPDLFRNKK